MPKKIKKTCVQCGELLDRDKFYRVNRIRWGIRCKNCISCNNREIRNSNNSSERECKKCGQIKSNDQFKSNHKNSYCIECSQTHLRLKDRSEAICIQCGKKKSIEEFKSRNGKKCIECLRKNQLHQKREYNKKYWQDHFKEVKENPYKFGTCKKCKEVKSKDHFTKVKNYGGLSSICNECKELTRMLRNKKHQESIKIRKYKKSRLKFESELDIFLDNYSNSHIMNERDYMGYFICDDFNIRKVSGKIVKKLKRDTEHLYFKYFFPDKSMDDYYIDFKLYKLVKFDTLSNNGRPSHHVNRIRKIERDKRRKDPLWRLKNSMTSSFCQWMGGKKGKSTWKYVDYTLKELQNHLEGLFTEGMSWDNYGWDGWWIDHIIPRDSFDMNDSSQIKECWSLKNLQPLWKIDNITKGNSLI